MILKIFVSLNHKTNKIIKNIIIPANMALTIIVTIKESANGDISTHTLTNTTTNKAQTIVQITAKTIVRIRYLISISTPKSIYFITLKVILIYNNLCPTDLSEWEKC